MLKEKKTTTQSKIPFLWLQARLPIHKREFSRIGWTPAARECALIRPFLSMVREPLHDKNLKSKNFLGFPNVPFNAVVFVGLDFFGLPQKKFLEWTRGNHL